MIIAFSFTRGVSFIERVLQLAGPRLVTNAFGERTSTAKPRPLVMFHMLAGGKYRRVANGVSHIRFQSLLVFFTECCHGGAHRRIFGTLLAP